MTKLFWTFEAITCEISIAFAIGGLMATIALKGWCAMRTLRV